MPLTCLPNSSCTYKVRTGEFVACGRLRYDVLRNMPPMHRDDSGAMFHWRLVASSRRRKPTDRRLVLNRGYWKASYMAGGIGYYLNRIVRRRLPEKYRDGTEPIYLNWEPV